MVVADAGPIHYLVLIECADILSTLFERVCVPVAVRNELLNFSAPLAVRDWISRPPRWLEIASVVRPQTIRGLHHGETEAIQLAIQGKCSTVLMDDSDGRTVARRLGLVAIGTIGLLERAAELDLLELSPVLIRLSNTSFFAPDDLFHAALERERRRKRRP